MICFYKQCQISFLFNSNQRTHLLHKGKYHCMTDLLFDRLGFGQTCKYVYKFQFNKTAESKPVKQEVTRSVIFPLYKVSECSLA